MQAIINADCIPSCQVRLRRPSTMLQHPFQNIRIHYERKSSNQHFKNVAPRHTVKYRAINHNLGSFLKNINQPLFSSSFPQCFSGRTNHTVGRPRSRRVTHVRINQRDNLFHRWCRLSNVCQIEQSERKARSLWTRRRIREMATSCQTWSLNFNEILQNARKFKGEREKGEIYLVAKKFHQRSRISPVY